MCFSLCHEESLLKLDYQSFRSDFNIDVLKSFVNLHEFTDTILVQALRWWGVVGCDGGWWSVVGCGGAWWGFC